MAEEAGVRIGIHPDDPPVPVLAGVPRCIFSNFEGYKRALEIANSPNVGICLCCGTWLEGGKQLTGKDPEEMIRHFGAKKIWKIHFRNVSAPLPHFVETFMDNGYYDMWKIMKALRDVEFDGIVILDHSPTMVGGNYTQTAYGFAYMKALLNRANAEAFRSSKRSQASRESTAGDAVRALHRAVGEFRLPTRHHPPPSVGELPDLPAGTWGIIGPGLVASGVGLASGEFVLWPFVASQVGLGFLWGALAGVAIQWLLNLEIERYTLATGETALTGFSRLWRPAGLAFVVAVAFANAWPGWATSSATLLTFLIGGDSAVIAVLMLVVAGAILTLAPVVYTALERLIVIKVAAIGMLAVLALWLVIEPASWPALAADAVSGAGRLPQGVSLPMALGAIAFAGAGGGQNLCQSNWIRDKGFGMGRYVPRLTSPITAAPRPAVDARACVFIVDEEGLGRWRRWWRFANVEQALTFVLVTIVTIVFTSVLAWSTVHGRPDLPNTIDFLRIEGEVLAERAAPGSAGCSGWSARTRFSPPRSGSSTTPRASPPTCSSGPTCGGADRREWALCRHRLDAGGERLRDPALRPRSAARPAGDLGLQRRGDDVRLRAAARRPQSADLAAGHRHPAVAGRRARALQPCSSAAWPRSLSRSRCSGCSDAEQPRDQRRDTRRVTSARSVRPGARRTPRPASRVGAT